ncbi:MAG: urea ABC transporter ATP-binding protein UrtD [Pseudomonadota bacterium]
MDRHSARSAIDTRHGVILYLEEISVSFAGFRALNKLSLAIDKGELRCLIGPNGAGKTTLMDVVTGKTKPDSGEAYLGQSINLLSMGEAAIANVGIGRKFQKPTVFAELSVKENLSLALAGNRGPWRALRYQESLDSRVKLEALAEQIALETRLDEYAGGLSHGQKQWLELGMLLAQDPTLLLIDEPVAGMTDAEVEKTSELLRALVPERTVVVVEHDMNFIRSISERVTVLHEGSVLTEGLISEVQSDARVREVYLGEC